MFVSESKLLETELSAIEMLETELLETELLSIELLETEVLFETELVASKSAIALQWSIIH